MEAEIRLNDLISVLPVKEVIGSDTIEIGKIEYDSREIEPDDVFVALVGANVDGHDYISNAVDKKAACLVVERTPDTHASVCVTVPDTREALALLSAKYYDYPSRQMKTLAVTGTNGKTTVTYLIKSIFEERGRRIGLIGTIEYLTGEHRISAVNTTPESLQLERLLMIMKSERIRTVVMEVSSHALVAGRVRMIDFDVVGITNLTQDHLDFHKTMQEYRDAKATLFDMAAGDDKWAVLNLDDSEYEFFRARVKSPYLSYSISDRQADLSATDIRTSPTGSSFHLITPLGEEDIALKLAGEHNVSNAVCAAAFAMAAGMDISAIKRGLDEASHVPGRLEPIENDRGIHIFVDYAHTPDALEHACSVCRSLTESKLVVLFGCGGDRDKSKRKLMGEAVSRYADRIVVTSDNPRSEDPLAIIEDIKPGLDSAVHADIVQDRKEAIKAALDSCSENDVLLVAGKGHEDYQIIGKTKTHFDDREIVRELLGKNA
ncbi:MAG: UDP-N-acetylmuramoyl-L-alanyl-D-glutamate--2,6-diaminopimelate ligase [Candidatus Zixiibacteriota bacterium]